MGLTVHEKRLRPLLKDPAKFSSKVLGFRLWSGQKQLMHDVAEHKLVAVKACHGSSKTFTAAQIGLWWLCRYPDALVVNTAPTWRQVRLFWAEVRNTLELTRGRFPLPHPSSTELRLSEKRMMTGISTSDAVKFQGLHGGHVLIIADEAPGIKTEIWEAIEGVRAAGHVHLLALGNPVVPGGKFFDAFGRDRGIWNAKTISAFDTPNFKAVRDKVIEMRKLAPGEYGHLKTDWMIEALQAMTPDERSVAPWPFLVSMEWVAERLVAWGPTHPMFQARALGQFPTASDRSVFSLAWIERMSHELEEEDWDKLRGAAIQIGIDVAGPGEDETALAARAGGFVFAQEAWREADCRGVLVAKIREIRARFRPVRLVVVVDAVGIGYHVWTHLAEVFDSDPEVEVYGFNAGQRALNPELFENAKAECVWALREWMERDAIIGVADLETQAQLAGMQHGYTAAGRVKIEKKEDAKKRGQASPDRAEALMMSCAPIVPRDQTVIYEQSGSISPV